MKLGGKVRKLFQSKPQIFLHGLRKGIFVEREEDGVLAQVLLGAVPVAFVRASVAPRVLDLVVFVVVLVLGDTNDKHTVVVARIPIVVSFLVVFIGHLFFGDDFFPKFLVFWVFGDDANTGLSRKALVADILCPTEGIAMLQCIVDCLHHLVKGHIVGWGPSPVVGDFDHAGFVVLFSSERAYFDVVGGVDAIGLGK